MTVDHRDWSDYVGLANFNAAKQSPFKVASGMDQFQRVDLALEGAHSTLEFHQDGEDLAKKHEQVLKKTKLLLKKTLKCYKKKSMLKDAKSSMRWVKRCC